MKDKVVGSMAASSLFDKDPGSKGRRVSREGRQPEMMNLDELKQILDIVREHQLTEFELEREGFKIKVRKDGLVDATMAPRAEPARLPAPAPAPIAAPREAAAAETAGEEAATEIELAMVKSPIVGTFYRAPEPGAPPYAEVGQRVKKGQVLCIIEAMKLMNEIESEYEGEIVTVYVENGQPVQYGERLFAIKR
jgi:acetyl-CoA carboxylase biotin carboxyl carrier protein